MLDLPTQRRIRRDSFRAHHPLNQRLISLVEGNDRHAFLRNPTIHNNFVYLVDYVRRFSERWFARPISDIRVLDWGCGKGQISYLLREIGTDVVSCDVQRDADDSSFGEDVPLIRKAGIPVVPLTHPYRLPFADASMDVVLSFGVLEHVPQDQESLFEIRRVLKPGGLFFCFWLPYTLSWTQRLSHLRGEFYHDRLYSKRNTLKQLEKAGLKSMDFWFRALLPKGSIAYPSFRTFEAIDQILCEYTPFKYFATNIEFVATTAPDGPLPQD